MHNSALNILILDASANHSEAVISALRVAGVAAEVKRPDDPDILADLLKTQHWDIALCDNKHPDITLQQFIHQRDQFASQLKWLMLVETLDGMTLQCAVEAGANDAICLSQGTHFLHALQREVASARLNMQLQNVRAQAAEFDRRQEQLLDASSDAIAYISDGIIVECNDAFAGLVDQPRDDLEAMPLFDFIDAAHREALKQALKQAAKGESLSLDIAVGEHSQTVAARLVSTFYEGEAAIQISFKDPHATTAKPQTTNADIDQRSAIIMQELAQADNGDGVLLFVEIDKVAQLRAKQGLISSRAVLKSAVEYIAGSLAMLGAWTREFNGHSVVAYTKTHSLASVREILPDVLKQVAEHMFEFQQKTVQVTCSIGVASRTDDIGMEQWLDNAYQAMFEARAENDGNAFKLFTANARAGVAGNTGMTLDDALELDRFRLSFQPLVNIKSNDEDYYEAYIRMLDQNDEEVSPALFIEAFTAREFNTKLDRWIILEACKQLSGVLPSAPETKLIINLTANALNDDKLVPWIAIALRTANIEPSRIVFQFLETNVESYLMRAIQVFKQLRELGCELSINRVGEESEAMKVFEKLTPRFAKLAPRFMQALQQDNNPEQLRQMITKVQQSGIEPIVGFIESANTMAMLWQMNASLIQGFYIAPPAPEMSYDFSDF